MLIDYLFGDMNQETKAENMIDPGTDQSVNATAIIEFINYSFYYSGKKALHNINMAILPREVTALIGPSGCGKSTLLRSINRMNDTIDGISHTGDIFVAGRSVFDPKLPLTALRRRVGMVFQKSNPFPKSIYENVVFGLRVAGEKRRSVLDETVEKSLRATALWDEVKDRIHDSALKLSGGQQQRLCIARAIALRPDVLLMDEPCAALDPISTMKIEELITELKKNYTIVIVTHNLQQAARCSDKTGFMYLGELIEFGKTEEIFTSPVHPKTQAYITGKMG